LLVGGNPARGALVVFHPLDNPDRVAVKPRAVVGRDGTFSLFSYRVGDGAPAGTYAVTVVWQQPRFRGGDPPPIDIQRLQGWKEKAAEWRTKAWNSQTTARRSSPWPSTTGGRKGRRGTAVKSDPVPARYRNPQSSDLRVEVTTGPNELAPFNLTK
jgi:hypothetical protein